MKSQSVLISLVFISFFIGGATHSASADLDRWTDFELEGARVDAVAFHPGDSDIIYLGTRGRGLYKSRDGGDTWAPVESFHQLVHHPANDTEFSEIAFHPADSTTIYVVTQGRVFRSADADLTWAQVQRLPGSVYCVAFDPQDPTSIYLGGSKGVSVSHDGAATWTALENSPTSVLDVRVLPTSPPTLYALRGRGFARSSDGGETWTQSDVGDTSTTAMAVDPLQPQTIYLATQLSGIFKSADGGATWNDIAGGLGGAQALALDPANPQVIYAGAWVGGVHRSEDGGANWSPVGLEGAGVRPIAIDPTDSSRLFVGDFSRLYRSTDRGANWRASHTGITDVIMSDVAVHPDDPDKLFAGAPWLGLFRSRDGGSFWEAVEGVPARGIQTVVFDPADPDRLYGGSLFDAGLFKSLDGGDTWSVEPIDPLPEHAGQIHALGVDSNSRLYALTRHGVYTSSDGGVSWVDANTGLSGWCTDLFAVPANAGTAYAICSNQVFRTTDGGTTWDQAGEDLDGVRIGALAADPGDAMRLYAGTAIGSSGGVYRSEDGGQSWSKVSVLQHPFTSFTGVSSILVSPLDPQILYLASSRFGIFRSRDGGVHWLPVNDGLDYFPVNSGSLHAVPGQPLLLFAASDRGLFALEEAFSLYFAQFAEGAGALISRILLANLDENNTTLVQARLKDGLGDPLHLDLNGADVVGEAQQQIPPSGLRSFEPDGEGPIAAGSVQILSDREVAGTIVFDGVVGLAGVGSSADLHHGFLAPIETNLAEGTSTGVAVRNLLDRPLVIQPELLDLDGAGIASAQRVTMNPQGQMALYVDQFSWEPAIDFNKFEGLLKITPHSPAGGALTATAIQTRPQEFVTMPVAPLAPPEVVVQDLSPQAASESLYFAHFGDGIGQLYSQIFFFNLGAVETTAHLILRDDDGQLLSVDLNGELVNGETEVLIPPSGLRILRTDGRGPLAAGAVTVVATEPLAGVILFGGSVGFAGVGRSLPLDDGFLAPLRADSETSTDTGIAVMNLEDTPLELELLLLNSDGELLATGHLDEPLAPFGHRGFYPSQAIWDAPVDFSKFEGLCEVTAAGRLAATVLLTRRGQFATQPVIPLPPAGNSP